MKGLEMNLTTFLLAVFIAIAYVAWPNLSKPLGVSGGLVAVVVVVVALVVILITSHKDIGEISTVSVTAWVWILAVAVVNGLAIYVYAEKCADSSVSTGMFLVTIFLIETFIAPLVDWLVNGSVPTSRQFAGLALAIPTMWLLAKI